MQSDQPHVSHVEMVNSILRKVSSLTGIPTEVLLSRRDGIQTERARRVAYLMMREEFSLSKVGEFFGRPGSTVFSVTRRAKTSDRATAARWMKEVRWSQRRRAIEANFEQSEVSDGN